HVEVARGEMAAAVRLVQRSLEAEQWARIPQHLREWANLPGPDRPPPQVASVLAVLDRLLANPLPVLIDLSEILGLNAEQVAALRAASDSLQVKLDERRRELAAFVATVPSEELIQLFQDLQPDI